MVTSQHSTWICATCGVAYEVAEQPPARCPICEDDRQWVPPDGQKWVTRGELEASRRNVIEEEEPGVWSIRTEPGFGIGQRAYLIQTGAGNLLWDCVTLIDAETVGRVKELGGIDAVAISHAHYYSSMVEWSEAFGAPVWIHANDEEWILRRPADLRLWEGEGKAMFGGFSLVRSGGHFRGYQVGHWAPGAGGAGAIFAGDQPQVCPDRKWVSFLYSYPNMIPFHANTVRRIAASLAPLGFDRIYGAFGRNVMTDAKGVMARSVERYLRAVEVDPD